MERLDCQLFFDKITIAIDDLLHVLWHFCIPVHKVTLTDFRDSFAQPANCHTDLQTFLAPLLQLFWLKPKADQNAVLHGRLYVYT